VIDARPRLRTFFGATFRALSPGWLGVYPSYVSGQYSKPNSGLYSVGNPDLSFSRGAG